MSKAIAKQIHDEKQGLANGQPEIVIADSISILEQRLSTSAGKLGFVGRANATPARPRLVRVDTRQQAVRWRYCNEILQRNCRCSTPIRRMR
jgi:hypothetical protein